MEKVLHGKKLLLFLVIRQQFFISEFNYIGYWDIFFTP